jgi:F0F1-type ATP synthase alpha subunit
LEVAAAISTYIHNRLLDRIADFQRQQVTQAAIQALPAVNLTPAQ